MRLALALLMSASVMASPAMAQGATEPMDTDKYLVVEIDEGVLRIDRQTGDISECQETRNGWVCRLIADDRLAYEAEINRLDAEVERLEEELRAARQALEDADLGEGDDLSLVPEADPDDPTVRERLDLPTQEELDAVMDTAEEVMRRFFDMVQGLRDDIEAERAP
jgi:arylsulfatase A-like enzyme